MYTIVRGEVIVVNQERIAIPFRVAVCINVERNGKGESMNFGDVIGECKIGDKTYSVKKIESQDSVVIHLTEKGSDLPISGAQIKVQKDPFGVALEDIK